MQIGFVTYNINNINETENAAAAVIRNHPIEPLMSFETDLMLIILINSQI